MNIQCINSDAFLGHTWNVHNATHVCTKNIHVHQMNVPGICKECYFAMWVKSLSDINFKRNKKNHAIRREKPGN